MPKTNQVLVDHERYARRLDGGCKAQFRFANLPGMDLQRRQLKEIEFLGCNLRGSRMALSNFSLASFYGSDLSNCDLRGSHLVRADMRGTALAGARLGFANLDGADFRKASLLKVDESTGLVAWQGRQGGECEPVPVDFSDASLCGAKLSHAKLQGAIFDGALLQGADLQGANLTGATFRNAILLDTNLDGAMLSEGTLAGALLPPGRDAQACRPDWNRALAESRLWVETHGQEGAKARLDGADLRVMGDALKKARLPGASLKNVCAVGVDFSGASLVAADFSGADLRFAKFIGADLRGCNFSDSQLTQASFAGANLLPLQGVGDRNYQPRFTGSRIDNLDLENARLDSGLLDALETLACPLSMSGPDRLAGSLP